MTKTLHNSDISGAKKNVSDLKTFGDGDMFKLLSKASSKKEGWMKSTKAMEIPGVGCVVQVTTQQGDNVAEAVCFVPGVMIVELPSEEHVNGRRLVEVPLAFKERSCGEQPRGGPESDQLRPMKR